MSIITRFYTGLQLAVAPETVCNVIHPVTVPALVNVMVWSAGLPTVNEYKFDGTNVYSDWVPNSDMPIASWASPIDLIVPCTIKSASEVQDQASDVHTGPTVIICENAGSGEPCIRVIIITANTITTIVVIVKKSCDWLAELINWFDNECYLILVL